MGPSGDGTLQAVQSVYNRRGRPSALHHKISPIAEGQVGGPDYGDIRDGDGYRPDIA